MLGRMLDTGKLPKFPRRLDKMQQLLIQIAHVGKVLPVEGSASPVAPILFIVFLRKGAIVDLNLSHTVAMLNDASLHCHGSETDWCLSPQQELL